MFDIPKEQLQFLTEKKFTVEEMAQLFGVSKRTLERCLSDFGLSVTANYARLTDAELDATVNHIIADFPNVGCKRMSGLLLGHGLRIQQSRIQECMRQVNPEGMLLRPLEFRLIQRRSYYVQGPLSLWHRRKPQINQVIITLFILHDIGRKSVYWTCKLIVTFAMTKSEERTIIPRTFVGHLRHNQ